MADEAVNYRDTLNLPKTDFQMRGQLPKREPEMIGAWTDSSLYQEISKKNEGRPLFTLPDGPPYANGKIHLGHVLNKVLKDITIKYKNMSGYHAVFVPGWDCHGLPIEHKILEALEKKKKTVPKEVLRKLCREEALKWVHAQKEQFIRLGILADWENPYLTLNPGYEAETVRQLAEINDQGFLVRGEKPIYWCVKTQTALAEAEVEYQEKKSDSIYVKFELTFDGQKKLALDKKTSILIWTTTPWTLPANLGISFHPDFEYAAYEYDNEYIVLAKERASILKEEEILPSLGAEVKSFVGKDFEKLQAKHPFLERTSLCILGNHVTLEAGTGCVHTAPGHGLDDYKVGLKYGLELLCPVSANGVLFGDVGEGLEGVHVFKANPIVIEKLKENKSLVYHTQFKHSYPHNWRSKTPLIYRLTPQWFLEVHQEGKSIRDKAYGLSNEGIEFIPEWGRARMKGMLETRPDWCLSRQRAWGVPLPIFYCTSCETPLVDSSIMRKVADKMEQGSGINEYFENAEAHNFTEGASCSSCSKSEFRAGQDILDVWFDSGICHSAVQKKREFMEYPADVYLEGSDQHRGWFQTALLSALGSGKEAPFKTLVTHGFVNDAKGKKMSKSQGNVISPEEIYTKQGAEILRLWVAYEDYGNDVNVSQEIFQRVIETYRRLRNSYRFLLGNLYDFNPEKDTLNYDQLLWIDKWALRKLDQTLQQAHVHYENMDFYKVFHLINRFFTVDLSARYFDFLKDRLYTFEDKSLGRRSAQTVFYHLIENLTSLLAPITSFLSEEAYAAMPGKKAESVHLTDISKSLNLEEDKADDALLEKVFELKSIALKMIEDLRADKKLGSSLEAEVALYFKEEDFLKLEGKEGSLEEIYIVSKVILHKADEPKVEVHIADQEKCPRCWRRVELVEEKNGLCHRCEHILVGL